MVDPVKRGALAGRRVHAREPQLLGAESFAIFRRAHRCNAETIEAKKQQNSFIHFIFVKPMNECIIKFYLAEERRKTRNTLTIGQKNPP